MSEEIIYKKVPSGKRFYFHEYCGNTDIVVEVFDGEIQSVAGYTCKCTHWLPEKCDWSSVNYWLSEAIKRDEKQFKKMASMLSEDSGGFKVVKGIIYNRIHQKEEIQEIRERWRRYL